MATQAWRGVWMAGAVAAGAIGPGCAAVLGIEELPAGEERDGGSDASVGGGGGGGQLGETCAPANARACEGHAARQQLICEGGRWVRGGDFFYGTSNLLASYRDFDSPAVRNSTIGARCARSAP